ncbi:hypothetical protein [Rhodanobacter lindaniclasticus]
MFDIKKTFDEMTKGAQQLRASASNLRSRIAALDSERTTLRAAPITASDYVELIHADIDRVANRVRDQLAMQIERLAEGCDDHGHQQARVSLALTLKARDRPVLLGHLRSLNGGDFDTQEFRQDMATFFMRDELKAAATEAVEAIKQWPFPDAQPMAKSLARIRAIDTEVSRLSAELEALEQHAAELNLSI